MGLTVCVVTVELLHFNFNNVKHAVCIIYLHFVLTLHCVCVYIFHRVEHLIIGYVIRMATASKTQIKHNQISIERKVDVTNNVDATSGMLCNTGQ
jgi:hypothetical protein